MVPMIDLLMVTVSFLLLTAVWTRAARLEGTARVPGPPDISSPPAEIQTRLHVEVPPADGPLKLSLRRGAEVLDSRTVARAELGAGLDDMRRAHSVDLAGEQGRVVVLHPDDALPYRDMVAVMDAIAKDPRARINVATK